MSMQSEGNDAKGRNYDNVTKSNSTSAGSLGAGGTGGSEDVSANRQSNNAGNMQGGARTDDLLSPNPDSEQKDSFEPSELAGELETGLGGIGSLSTGNAGNRQSEGEAQPGGKDDPLRSGASSQGARLPESGGKRMQE